MTTPLSSLMKEELLFPHTGMDLNTAQKARIAMAKVMLRAAEKNFAVSVPTTHSVRYDLIFAENYTW